ncbi:hypothetical protein KIW84_052291 [Lathyrus oleraceus]|uniref:Pentatricopeptide repeat-containing protein n=1 Tax=Pisum sativum TaxID=3888 RepID=A0A9D4WRA9_PEA|nr:hypothetical protein KIW84_052291 [Pisum sativum]
MFLHHKPCYNNSHIASPSQPANSNHESALHSRPATVKYHNKKKQYAKNNRQQTSIPGDAAESTGYDIDWILDGIQRKPWKVVHGHIIRNRIQPDIFINSSLMDLYFKCGKIESAENIFKSIPKTTAVSWNVMISGYVTKGKLFEALGLFSEMRQSSVEPDAITFTSVLAAWSQLAAI